MVRTDFGAYITGKRRVQYLNSWKQSKDQQTQMSTVTVAALDSDLF